MILVGVAVEGQATPTRILITLGADINCYEGTRTPLLIAVEQYNPKAVALILASGASPDKVYRDTGSTALMQASGEGPLENVKLLLKYKANIHLKDNKGDDAMAYAKRGENPQSIALLEQARVKK